MSKNKASLSSKELIPLITAIIGVVGTVAVAYFSYRGIVAPKELEISAAQTAESFRATQSANIVQTPTVLPENLQTSVPTNDVTHQGIKGYMLFWDGKLVSGSESSEWTCKQGLANLLWNIKQYPEKEVEGRFDGKKMEITGTGYELFWDCERVGYEPQWTKDQASENLYWNINNHPEKMIDGLYNGEPLITP